MIDHMSIAVRNLERSGRFYDAVLATIGMARLVTRPSTIGFGKTYPEFWLNERVALAPLAADSGVHIALRAPSAESVAAFYEAALRKGGSSDGAPGPRPEYTAGYYAAFVRDPDGNRIEAVTFLR
jgi:catechol 2,3-dioxygenase-like lactoylglutathione lyase family enzyme